MEKDNMIKAINELAKRSSCNDNIVTYNKDEYEVCVGVDESLMSMIIRKDMPDGDYDTTATDAVNILNAATPLGCHFIEEVGGKKKYAYRTYIPYAQIQTDEDVKSFVHEVENRANEGYSMVEVRLILSMNAQKSEKMI
jgi:hypothetical protein